MSAEPRLPAPDGLQALGIDPSNLVALPGDVSPRRYFRVAHEDGSSLILATYPDGSDDEIQRFLESTELFDKAGVSVPRVLSANAEHGCLLLEDLGNVSLYSERSATWDELKPRFEKAIEYVLQLQRSDPTPFRGRGLALDARRLRSELREAEALLLRFLHPAPIQRLLSNLLDALCEGLEAEALRPCHRDFMARNLMLPDRNRLVVIDHQDACLAPASYDIASLLNDSLFPPADVEAELLYNASLAGRRSPAYARCVVQRALKAATTFVKFACRGFPSHLPLVAPSLERARAAINRLPEAHLLPEDATAPWADPMTLEGAMAKAVSTLSGQC